MERYQKSEIEFEVYRLSQGIRTINYTLSIPLASEKLKTFIIERLAAEVLNLLPREISHLSVNGITVSKQEVDILNVPEEKRQSWDLEDAKNYTLALAKSIKIKPKFDI